MAQTSFSMTLAGRGWNDKLTETSDAYSKSPDKEMVVRVSGPEPGYVATPICLIQCALVIIKETEKLPKG